MKKVVIKKSFGRAEPTENRIIMKKYQIVLFALACLFVCSAVYAVQDLNLYVKNRVYMSQKFFPLVPFPNIFRMPVITVLKNTRCRYPAFLKT